VALQRIEACRQEHFLALLPMKKKEVLHLCELLFHFRLCSSFYFQFFCFYCSLKKLVVEVLF
jgi:hypothetical protein